MIVVDPYQTKIIKIGDIDYVIRGLTAREQMNIMDFDTLFKGTAIKPGFMAEVVEKGLVDWKNSQVEFNKTNSLSNIDRLEKFEILQLFTEIMQMGKVDIEQVKK